MNWKQIENLSGEERRREAFKKFSPLCREIAKFGWDSVYDESNYDTAASEILDCAIAKGWSPRTVQQVARRLGIKRRKHRFTESWWGVPVICDSRLTTRDYLGFPVPKKSRTFPLWKIRTV
jgi:hypothetical protein